MPNIHIYLGPTITAQKAKEYLPCASFHEPIKAGDIHSLLNDSHNSPPDIIHIIDGYYYSVPSIRHKEIEQALSQGIIVTGCSSLGALRASECSEMGMIGFDRVFN